MSTKQRTEYNANRWNDMTEQECFVWAAAFALAHQEERKRQTVLTGGKLSRRGYEKCEEIAWACVNDLQELNSTNERLT